MAAAKSKKTRRSISGKISVKKPAPRRRSSSVATKKNRRKALPKPRSRTRQPVGRKRKILSPLKKFNGNPILGPSHHPWESEAVFNPGAVIHDDRIHLFYRALGPDGMSRIGYASSKDGVHFDERLPHPVYSAHALREMESHFPFTSPARKAYDRALYASGGGWGGSEDPRAVKIDGRIYLTFNMFNGWNSMRVAFTSLHGDDLSRRHWDWAPFTYLSPLGDRQKNWVLFPEKINGKFALLHNIDKGDSSRVHIAYLNELHPREAPTQAEAPDVHTLPDHLVAWHHRTRSAAAPPIKTPEGWLLFYHAMDTKDRGRYKVGALLLDINDPSRVLYRSAYPLLEPNEWYENDWKPGIIYANGAVVKDDTLFIYYGGGDKRIGVARAPLAEFLRKLMKNEHAVFTKEAVTLA